MKPVITVLAFCFFLSSCGNPVQNGLPSPEINSTDKATDNETATNIQIAPADPEPIFSQSESKDNDNLDKSDDISDSNDSNDPTTDIQHTDSVNNDNYIVDPIDYGGYDDDFDRLFIDSTNDTAFLDQIVGRDELNKFIDEEIEPHKFEKQNLPLAYKIIQYFNIQKDVLIEYNNKAIIFNEEHGTAITTYEDYIIEAFYCGDLEKMRHTLKSPYVLYQNQEFYTIYDLFGMEIAEIAGLGLSRNELISYTDTVHSAMKSFSYDNEEHFSKLIEKIEQINP